MTPVPGFDAATGEVVLLDAAAARDGDAAAVEAGDTWAGLMDRAAHALAVETIRFMGQGYGLRVAIVVGKGNNGGDGWGAARVLRRHGAQVRIVAPYGLDTEASDEATANRDAWRSSGGWASGDPAAIDGVLGWADVAIDAVLGTGTTGAPRGEAADVVAALRAARDDGVTIVACDIPTGVSSDDGVAGGGDADLAVVADLTVTFGALKRGLVLHPGRDHAGRIVVASLGPRYRPPGSSWRSLTAAGAAPPPLPASAEKRSRGVVLAVCGGVGTAGAAALCGRGLLAGGAGLVTVAVPYQVASTVAALVPSAMTRPTDLDDADRATTRDLPDVDRFDAVVAGPGLGLAPSIRGVVDHLRRSAGRLVLDADALNVHRDDPDVLADHAGDLVLTPHVRELARLSGRHDADQRRTETAVDLARRLRATVVAKGPATVVAAPDGRVWVTPVGGPALATGGTGDVLAGLIGAAIAGTDDVPRAVAIAVWQHAFAGDVAGGDHGGRLTAEALVAAMPAAMADLRELATTTPTFPFGA